LAALGNDRLIGEYLCEDVFTLRVSGKHLPGLSDWTPCWLAGPDRRQVAIFAAFEENANRMIHSS
jgi:hypothetical protein